MNFSLWSGKRGATAAAAALTIALVVSGCSGSDESSPLDEKTSAPASPTPKDPTAEITALVDRYWDVEVAAENSANTDRAQFSGIAEGAFLENVFRKLDKYKDEGIKRVGAPKITAVEVTVDGTTATIAHCIDEDQWTAERNGEPLDPILSGNRPFGLTATLTGDAWIITDTGLSKAEEKAKSCP